MNPCVGRAPGYSPGSAACPQERLPRITDLFSDVLVEVSVYLKLWGNLVALVPWGLSSLGPKDFDRGTIAQSASVLVLRCTESEVPEHRSVLEHRSAQVCIPVGGRGRHVPPCASRRLQSVQFSSPTLLFPRGASHAVPAARLLLVSSQTSWAGQSLPYHAGTSECLGSRSQVPCFYPFRRGLERAKLPLPERSCTSYLFHGQAILSRTAKELRLSSHFRITPSSVVLTSVGQAP